MQLELIHRAVSVKASVVGQDFKESYLREILNYGHTLGHAIEKHSKYKLRHGEAVSIGMIFVAELAAIKIGLPREIVDKHRAILQSLKLPTSYISEAWTELLATMSLDKKVKLGSIRFVAIDKVGSCLRIEDATSDEMRSAYERISE